jgi:hypothetical protein
MGLVLLVAVAPVLADWAPGDGHKMHWPQLPDPVGWDVNATWPVILAEDFRCTETGPIKDLHFWGSWRHGDEGVIRGFYVSIHEDIADPDGDGPLYSKPGTTIFDEYISAYLIADPIIEPGSQGWYDPITGEVVIDDHVQYYGYNIFLPEELWVDQVEGNIYWVNISADVEDPENTHWGWKSTTTDLNYQDDAVVACGGNLNWVDLYHPSTAGFRYIPGDVNGDGIVDMQDVTYLAAYVSGGGPPPPYFIPCSNPPFYAAADVNGDCVINSLDVSYLTAYIQGGPPPTFCPAYPPMADWGPSLNLSLVITGGIDVGACCHEDGTCTQETQASCQAVPTNVYLGDGSVCLGDGDGNGVDDACEQVVPTGACCFADGTCAVTTQAGCALVSGQYAGDGTACQGDGNGNGVDDACEGLVPSGACCWPNGTCSIVSQVACTNGAGTYMGDNTFCLGDLDGNGVDDACEQVQTTGACCYEDGSCASGITRLDCVMAGGTYMGDATTCLGDGNSNGTDDLCEDLPELKWFQPPDLTPDGMDVNATYDPTGLVYLLASDFQCDQPGPITEIHIFGSWLGDNLPQGSPAAVTFYLSMHPDVPDPDGPTGPEYSMPGPSFWNNIYDPGAFEVRVHAAHLEEAWFDPPQGYIPQGDRVCYEYIFYLGPEELIQEGTSTDPIIYWLNVQAFPAEEGTFFGWKTAIPPEWNDDAVYFNGMDDPGGQLPWLEMRYPDAHDLHPASVDLAFQIWSIPTAQPTGACCYDDGSCVDGMTQSDCLQSGGDYGGDGSTCAGVDNDGNGVDDFCDGVVTLGACCYGNPLSPLCMTTTQSICEAAGGLAGTWYSGLDCATFTCPVAGACCYEDAASGWTCVVTADAATCEALPNGTWYEGQDCASITCPETGACCYDDGSCADGMTQSDCLQSGGDYGGNGSTCAGTDNDGNGVDDFCDGVVTLGACCYGDPTSPLCINTTQSVCEAPGGLAGTWYAGQDCATFTCPTQQTEGACCFADGSCAVMTESDCQGQSGSYVGNGTVCLGDGNQNGVDDACEEPQEFELKWEQLPDLETTGMDVLATEPVILADDFPCTVTGPIVKIEVYGSWYHDEVPGDPAAVAFTLSLHEDIPDPDGAGPEYSRPGETICVLDIPEGSYQVEVIPTPAGEAWFDPTAEYYEFPGDTYCFKYIFFIEDACWVQSGTPQAPRVYWLDVQAYTPIGQTFFGWKTAVTHWNDDGVWATGAEPDDISTWMELRYPPQHPWATESIDLAFAVYTLADTCAGQLPGDFDVDGDIDTDDLVGLVAHVEAGGPPSANPPNGDVNGDCRVNHWDVTYLTAYLYESGPAPVDCTCQDPYGYCCYGEVGNANVGPGEEPTIGDIALIIDALFITGSGDVLECLPEADVNQSGGSNPIFDDITIGDIALLIDYLFITGPAAGDLNDCFVVPK